MKTSLLPLFLLVLTLSLNSILAAQPTVAVPQATTGIVIEHPLLTDFEVNQTVKLHFHLYNSTDGKPFLNTSDIVCIFHLYNQTGSHLLKVNAVSSDDTYDWEQVVLGTNFSTVGNYAYVFQCNNTQIGGFYNHDFYVVPSIEYNLTFLIILLALAGLFFIATWVIPDGEFFIYLSGVLFLIAGIYIMINGIDAVDNFYSRTIAYVCIGLGLLFSMGAYLYNTFSGNTIKKEDDDF